MEEEITPKSHKAAISSGGTIVDRSEVPLYDENTYPSAQPGEMESSKSEPMTVNLDIIHDLNIVDWDGPNDPDNPMNWPAWKITAFKIVLSSLTFLAPLGSSIFAPGIEQFMQEFHSRNAELGSLAVSIYLLGFATRPLLLGPLSEVYGRRPVYLVSMFIFLTFTIACAVATSVNWEIVFHFLAACAGFAPLTLGGGSIADIIPREKRGAAMAIYGLGPVLGPVIGPVVGGFLAQAKGWRWIFWLLSIVIGFLASCFVVILCETYHPVLIGRKTRALQKSTGNMALQSKYATVPLKVSMTRPLKMLVLSPIILLLSLFVAVIYGYIYLLFTTFPAVFAGVYHFNTGITGLSYLGIGVGNLVGLVANGYVSDKILQAKAAKGKVEPENRLLPMVFVAPLMPIGLFIYGWSAERRSHWLMPIFGTGLFGIGSITAFTTIQTYLVDAFTIYAAPALAASALAATSTLRSTLGCVLPLAGPKMYQALGFGLGNSLLAFIALVMCPIPLFFYKYGERIRKSRRTAW